MVFNFRHYLEHSNQLSEFTLGQLKGIVEDYPYFQLARILYLKNLYLLQKLEFDCELKKSAVYIYNRPFLYDFLFEQTENKASIDSSDEEAKKKDDITEDDTAPTEENSATEISNEIETKETQITKTKPEEEEEEEAKSSKKNFSDNIKVNISDLLDDQLIDADKKSDDLQINPAQMDVEKEYGKDLEKKSKKQETFVLLDDNQATNNIKTTDDSDDKKRISNSISYAKDLLDFDYVLRNTVRYSQKEKDPEKESNSEKSFTEWLDSINKPGTKTDETKKTEPDKIKNLDSSEPEDKGVKNQIIDNFLQTNPAIKPEDKPFEFEDISTESIKEDDGLVTDTLARIYFNQARYDKALEAYEKLSLKYPEKSSYFATQIEKIKNKLNDLK